MSLIKSSNFAFWQKLFDKRFTFLPSKYDLDLVISAIFSRLIDLSEPISMTPLCLSFE